MRRTRVMERHGDDPERRAEMLQQTVREFVAEHAPGLPPARHARHPRTRTASRAALWKEMAELGWTGITIPEEPTAAAGWGYAELGRPARAVRSYADARAAALEPGAGGGGDPARWHARPSSSDLLPALACAAATSVLTLAFQEVREVLALHVIETQSRGGRGDGYRAHWREALRPRRIRTVSPAPFGSSALGCTSSLLSTRFDVSLGK